MPDDVCKITCGYISFQIDADDDIVVMLGKQIVVDYRQQKVLKLWFVTSFLLLIFDTLHFVLFYHFEVFLVGSLSHSCREVYTKPGASVYLMIYILFDQLYNYAFWCLWPSIYFLGWLIFISTSKEARKFATSKLERLLTYMLGLYTPLNKNLPIYNCSKNRCATMESQCSLPTKLFCSGGCVLLIVWLGYNLCFLQHGWILVFDSSLLPFDCFSCLFGKKESVKPIFLLIQFISLMDLSTYCTRCYWCSVLTFMDHCFDSNILDLGCLSWSDELMEFNQSVQPFCFFACWILFF